jgi:hypothetical protein
VIGDWWKHRPKPVTLDNEGVTDVSELECYLVLTHVSATDHPSRITHHESPITNHQSPLLIRYLLYSGLGAEFVGKEREDIGLVSNLLIQRTPDAMSK